MKTFFDVVHGVEFGDQGKKRWTKCGVLIQHDDGGMSLKIEYMPTDSNGWFNVFPQDKKENTPEPGTGDDVLF